MHVFARGGGKFGVLYCKYECVIQRVASLIYKLTHVTMHVNKNMHVFARGGGNFDVSAEGRIKTWLMHVLSHAFLLDESFVSESN